MFFFAQNLGCGRSDGKVEDTLELSTLPKTLPRYQVSRLHDPVTGDCRMLATKMWKAYLLRGIIKRFCGLNFPS